MPNNTKKYTEEMLRDAIKVSYSWAEVCRRLGVKPFTGSHSYVTKLGKQCGEDYSHFLGKSFNKGRKFTPKRPITDYLSNKTKMQSARLKSRLIKEGIKQHICELCNTVEWRGQPIPLELDHIDSDHFNNYLENLQIICPNCHAQETSKRGLDKKEKQMI